MEKAVIYCRVSSDEQKKTGFSLDYQEKQAREYAQKKDLEIIEVFSESYTAKKQGRPAFNNMIKLVKKKRIPNLIFLKSDRASRNGVDSAQLVYMAEYQGFNIHLIQDGLVLNKQSRPTDYMIFEMANVIANFYPRNLSVDSSTKMREKAEQGYYPSRAPFGYINPLKKRRERSSIQIDETKAPFIKRLFELYATGRYSYDTVGKQLHDEGFSRYWTYKANIERYLNDPIYMGDFMWAGVRYFNGKHEPIISRELWTSCQHVLHQHSNNNAGTTKHKFLFSGLLRCEKCGCLYVGEIKKKKYIYYRCTGNKGGICKKQKKYIKEEVVEQAIVDFLEKLSMPDDYVKLAKKCLKNEFHLRFGEIEETSKKIKAETKKENEKLNKLIDLLLDDSLDKHAYSKKKSEIEDRINYLNIELKNSVTKSFDLLSYTERVLELVKNASLLYLHGNNDEKREILTSLCSNFFIKDGKVVIAIKKAFQPFVEIAYLKNGGQSKAELELLRLSKEVFETLSNGENIVSLFDFKTLYNKIIA